MSSVSSSSGTTLQLQFKDSAGVLHNLPYPLDGNVTSKHAFLGRYSGGRVIWAEDFESPGSLQNWFVNDGNQARISRSALKSRTGRYSLHMVALNSYSLDIARTVALDSSAITKLGFEGWFSYNDLIMHTTGGTPALGPSLERWNGTYFEEYQCLYIPTTNSWTLDFDGSPGAVSNVANKLLSPYDPTAGSGKSPLAQAWHHFKLIVDISSKVFKTLQVDNTTTDLTTINGGSTLGPFGAVGGKTITADAQDTNIVRLELHLLSGGTNYTGLKPAEVFYDDIILTDES